MRFHFCAFECLNSFNSCLRSILKNLKRLDLLLTLLFREYFPSCIRALKYVILVVINGQKLMIFLLVLCSNYKRLLFLDDFRIFIAWICGNSLLLLLVCLYDIFFHFSINGPDCLSNFTVNLLMASRAASERICGECRRLDPRLDHLDLLLIFFLVRWSFHNLLLRLYPILYLCLLLLQFEIDILLFLMAGNHFLYLLGFGFLRLFER